MKGFTFSPHLIHLFLTTLLTLFLRVFNLQGKDTMMMLTMDIHGNTFRVSPDATLLFAVPCLVSWTQTFSMHFSQKQYILLIRILREHQM
jgi:hypothetical protein